MAKEEYLTAYNLAAKRGSWIKALGRRKRWPNPSGRAALLILDMQRFFLDRRSHAFVPSASAIAPVISRMATDFPGEVILTRHVEDSNRDNLMNIWWRDTISGRDADIAPELVSLGEVVEKTHYSAFVGTALESTLRERQVDSVIITGVMTDLCCETTARDAFMRGFKVYFVADATATYTEERHFASLRIINEGFGEVITSEELMWQL